MGLTRCRAGGVRRHACGGQHWQVRGIVSMCWMCSRACMDTYLHICMVCIGFSRIVKVYINTRHDSWNACDPFAWRLAAEVTEGSEGVNGVARGGKGLKGTTGTERMEG